MTTSKFQVKNAEEKARKALTDASRLGEELRSEQEHGMAADKAAKVLAAQSAGLDTLAAILSAFVIKILTMLFPVLSLSIPKSV